jgi:cell division septal protein FtsQ
MPDDQHKPEEREIDPAQMAKLLELEHIQKRMARQKAQARRANYRAISFLFLFAVLVGALLAFYLFFNSGAMEQMRRDSVDPAPTAEPSPPSRSETP